MPEVLCRNRGCNKSYDPGENPHDSCRYHPGQPIFHDAYKKWSCCEKKSTDFTQFLDFPGCKTGPHSDEAPPAPPKATPIMTDAEIDAAARKSCPKPPSRLERPSGGQEKFELRSSVANSLLNALQKHKEKAAAAEDHAPSNDAVQIGAQCKNNTCEQRYLGAESSGIECEYHPGAPVFHEGYKFWSCCQKRKTDFEEFLKQKGCTRGEHRWMHPSDVAEKKANCRFDWHQTGNNVNITVYAKVCVPEKCSVKTSDTELVANLIFEGGSRTFVLDLKLNGIVDPALSSVEYTGAKTEIKLVKRELVSWPALEFKES